MNFQVADMISNTGLSLHSLEKERSLEKKFTFTESLQPSKHKPEHWQNLGFGYKARTKTLEALSREIKGTITENCSEKTAVLFTSLV